jgi:hypothetical protein
VIKCNDDVLVRDVPTDINNVVARVHKSITYLTLYKLYYHFTEQSRKRHLFRTFDFEFSMVGVVSDDH